MAIIKAEKVASKVGVLVDADRKCFDEEELKNLPRVQRGEDMMHTLNEAERLVDKYIEDDPDNATLALAEQAKKEIHHNKFKVSEAYGFGEFANRDTDNDN